MVSEQKPSQAMSNDDIDDILELVDVVEVGKVVPETPSGDAEADFAADLDSMLNDLETKEASDMPFPDPTPVDYEVDPNESLDLPSMDDLDTLLAELGAEKPGAAAKAADSGAAGDSLDSEDMGIDGNGNKATITAALDQALSNLDELDALDESAASTVTPDESVLDADELDNIFARAASEASDADTGPAPGLLPEPTPELTPKSATGFAPDTLPSSAESLPHTDFEAAEMVHPDDIFLDISGQPDAEESNQPVTESPESILATETSPAGTAETSVQPAMPDMPDMPDTLGQPDFEAISMAVDAAKSAPSGEQTARESLPLDIDGLVEATLNATPQPPTPQDETTVDMPELATQFTAESGAEAPGASHTGMEPVPGIAPDTTGEPAPVMEATSAKGAVSGTRIDEDLNELDALLDDMLSSVPVATAGVAEERTMDSSPTSDEIHDIFERLDNLESSTATEQLFERCNTLEKQLAQKDTVLRSLEEALALKENQMASLEETFTSQQKHVAGLEEALTYHQEYQQEQATKLAETLAGHQEQVSGLEETLAGYQGQVIGLEETLVTQQEQVSKLEALLNEQKEHMAALDADMEKMVATAAAKVIREEIAALIQSMQDEE